MLKTLVGAQEEGVASGNVGGVIPRAVVPKCQKTAWPWAQLLPQQGSPKGSLRRAKEVMNPRMLALGEALDPRGAKPLHWALESEAQSY